MRYAVFAGLGILAAVIAAAQVLDRLPQERQWQVLCLTHLATKPDCDAEGWHRAFETPTWREDDE